MTHQLNGGTIPIISGDKKPEVYDFDTPKVADLTLAPGFFLARPLRAPRRSTILGVGNHESERFVVLATRPDDQLKLSGEIEVGMCVTMSGPSHAMPVRVDLAGVELGRANEEPDSKGRVIGDALIMVHGQIIAYDKRTIHEAEYVDIKAMVAQKQAEFEDNQRIDAALAKAGK